MSGAIVRIDPHHPVRHPGRFVCAVAALVMFTVAQGCANPPSNARPTAAPGGPLSVDMGRGDRADLTGAGATFPAPLYQAWFVDYHRQISSGVKINYQPIGSGGGIRQFIEGTVDFGATDAPMSDAELARAGGNAVHLPTVLGAVVATYNIAGLSAPLKLDGDSLARIYLGEITRWNDPALTALNPGVALPDAAISVVHRSDGSGTTHVWTDYLASVSTTWKSKVGVNKSPRWPAGQGAQGNAGIARVVAQTAHSIGYLELSYATENRLQFADIKNRAGTFVRPSLESASAAGAAASLPADYRASIVNSGGAAAYPIASFTYLLVHHNASDCSEAIPFARFLWWALHDTAATQTARDLFYAPLPPEVLTRVETTLKGLTCEGGPVL